MSPAKRNIFMFEVPSRVESCVKSRVRDRKNEEPSYRPTEQQTSCVTDTINVCSLISITLNNVIILRRFLYGILMYSLHDILIYDIVIYEPSKSRHFHYYYILLLD
jgi:hypothetical protein